MLLIFFKKLVVARSSLYKTSQLQGIKQFSEIGYIVGNIDDPFLIIISKLHFAHFQHQFDDWMFLLDRDLRL